MTFDLKETKVELPKAEEMVMRLMRKAHSDIDQYFCIGFAVNHPEVIIGYMTSYLKIIELQGAA